MARLMLAGLIDALNRPDSQISEHSTLELFVVIGSFDIRSYYFATATLNFGGVTWQPQLRKTDDIEFDLTSDGDEAVLELQNVDGLLGIEFVNLQQYLFGAEARVGRYWKDLDRGAEWHEIFLTGFVVGIDPGEMVMQLKVVADMYSGVSVGPLRSIQRACPLLYKGLVCGRPASDPPTCDYTLNGAGGCDGRWGSTNKFVRFGGAPYIDTNLGLKII